MAQINFPTATADGQTFEAPTGVVYTYVGTPPNGYWSGTFQSPVLTDLDTRYLKLDASNDPITGDLYIASNVGMVVQLVVLQDNYLVIMQDLLHKSANNTMALQIITIIEL